MKAMVIHRRHGLRPARFALRSRRPRIASAHPSWCGCRGCNHPMPADRGAARWLSPLAWALAGVAAGLLLVTVLTGPAGALLAAGIGMGAR